MKTCLFCFTLPLREGCNQVSSNLNLQWYSWHFAFIKLNGKFTNCLFEPSDIDDVPFSIHNGLVVIRIAYPHLCIIFFSLELQLEIQKQNLGVLKALWLLLKTGIGKAFLEANTFNKHRIRDRSTCDLLDAYTGHRQIITKHWDGIHRHLGKECLVVSHQPQILSDLIRFSPLLLLHLFHSLYYLLFHTSTIYCSIPSKPTNHISFSWIHFLTLSLHYPTHPIWSNNIRYQSHSFLPKSVS